MSSIHIHNMVNFGALTAEIVSLVWGTPANFNGFRVLVSLLQRRRSMEGIQTLHDVWPSPGLVHCIYIFVGSFPLTENFARCKIHYMSKSCIRLTGSVIARHSSSGQEPGFAALSTGRHLYSAGQPSPWALAHILVGICIDST